MRMNKYILEIEEEQTIEMTAGWIPAAQLQVHKIALWVQEMEDAPLITRTFKLYATGESIDPNEVYVGTVQTLLVKTTYHVYEVMPVFATTATTDEDD